MKSEKRARIKSLREEVARLNDRVASLTEEVQPLRDQKKKNAHLAIRTSWFENELYKAERDLGFSIAELRSLGEDSKAKARKVGSGTKKNGSRTFRYFAYFLPKKDREILLGDIEECYELLRKDFGKKKADCWMAYQVAAAFVRWISRAIKNKATFGLYDVVVNWIGRKTS